MAFKTVSVLSKIGHLTALEKKAVLAIVNAGWLSGSTSRKHFELSKHKKGEYTVIVRENRRSDSGRRYTAKNTVKVKLK